MNAGVVAAVATSVPFTTVTGGVTTCTGVGVATPIPKFGDVIPAGVPGGTTPNVAGGGVTNVETVAAVAGATKMVVGVANVETGVVTVCTGTGKGVVRLVMGSVAKALLRKSNPKTATGMVDVTVSNATRRTARTDWSAKNSFRNLETCWKEPMANTVFIICAPCWSVSRMLTWPADVDGFAIAIALVPCVAGP